MSEIEARVYDGENPTSLVATLVKANDRKWITQHNDVGSGSLKIHDSVTAERDACDYDNIVRFSLDGVDRGAFIIERRRMPPAPEGEEPEKEWTVSGRGVMALLEDGVVLPEAWVEGRFDQRRAFDWTAIVYDDSSWIAATQHQRQDAGSGPYVGKPDEWPDPLAYWIWSRAQGTTPTWVPTGTSYFRKPFTLASAKNVAVFATADNAFRLWIDGDVVLENYPGDGLAAGWHQTYRADLLLGPGTHQIAVEGINYLSVAGAESPAALLVSVIETDSSNALGTVLVRSDNTWLCLDYPADVPGMTAGEIIRILIEEAQARGALAGITLGFTDATDSNGAGWDVEPDISVAVGTHLLDVMKMLMEQFVDGDMTPALQLRVYNKGTRGSDLTGTVSLAVGADFELLELEGEAAYANAALARDALGALTMREDAASLASGKRKETYLELASAPNKARAQAMVDEIFLEFSYPTVQMTSKVTKDCGPYSEWTDGDTILVPNEKGNAQATTVLSIAVGEDEAGHPIFHAEGAQDAAA